MPPEYPERPTRSVTRFIQACKDSPLKVVLPTAVLTGIWLALIWSVLFSAPASFKSPSLVRVKEGTSISAEASALKEQHIVRSAMLVKVLVRLFGGESGLVAGDYFFPGPQNVIRVAHRLAQGDFELDPVKVTIPEGSTVAEVSLILRDKLQFFDWQEFDRLSQGKEGYLFPDTYYFLPTEDPQVVLTMMQNNFNKRLEPLRPAIAASGHTLHEILTMASLLEEEARTSETRKMISGVLWNRIKKGMRLQVDAVFPYIIGKNTFQVTIADLQTDSPYNTYKYAGLPPGPISNPGIVSINAALHPTPSKYLYYLADKNGVTHFSTTYAEHLRKQRLYLGTGY